MTEIATVAESSAERLARAKALDKEAQRLRDVLHEKWWSFASVLHPIWKDELWRDLGYNNWSDYIHTTLNLPVTTVGNWLLPMRKLLLAGVDPEIAKEVPLSRVGDLAMLAQASEGRIDPEILEQAKTARSRQETQAFKETVHREKERLGIEDVREIKLIVNESLYDLFSTTTNLVAKLAQEPREKRHEILTLEMALVALIESPEIQEIIKGE